jgi:heterodisulfide reductase subunit D
VIAAVAGSGLIEMERNCRDTWCCGAGGSVRLGKRAYAVDTARERLDEAVQTGADLLITACPQCIENFSDAKQEYAVPLELIDIAELVARSIA